MPHSPNHMLQSSSHGSVDCGLAGFWYNRYNHHVPFVHASCLTSRSLFSQSVGHRALTLVMQIQLLVSFSYLTLIKSKSKIMKLNLFSITEHASFNSYLKDILSIPIGLFNTCTILVLIGQRLEHQRVQEKSL